MRYVTRRAAGNRRSPSTIAAGASALAALAVLLGGPGLVVPAGAVTPFDEAVVRLEQNATDEDFEVVFDITGGDEGLERLTITAPNGRVVLDFSAPDRSMLGMRHLAFESPEPPDLESVTASYPEGVYRFSGAFVSGEVLGGEATLSHELPPTVSAIRPADEATGVPIEDVVISWQGVPSAVSYALEVEQEELGVSVKATLAGSATSFSVPDGFLTHDTEYKVAIGTVSESGNLSVVEVVFTTGD